MSDAGKDVKRFTTFEMFPDGRPPVAREAVYAVDYDRDMAAKDAELLALAPMKSNYEALQTQMRADLETIATLQRELEAAKAVTGKLRADVESIVQFDRTRGYPIGSEWVDFIEQLKGTLAEIEAAKGTT